MLAKRFFVHRPFWLMWKGLTSAKFLEHQTFWLTWKGFTSAKFLEHQTFWLTWKGFTSAKFPGLISSKNPESHQENIKPEKRVKMGVYNKLIQKHVKKTINIMMPLKSIFLLFTPNYNMTLTLILYRIYS